MINIIGLKSGGFMVVKKGRLAGDMKECDTLSSAFQYVPIGEKVTLDARAVNLNRADTDAPSQSEVESQPPSDDEMATMFDGLGAEPKQEE